MRHVFTQKFKLPLNQWDFLEQPSSTPSISNLSANIYFSLSHSNGLICFVTSSSPIGIDIEDISKKRNYCELAETFMSNQEILNLKQRQNSDRANYFYRIWCAKEAYYKAHETHSKLNLNGMSILSTIKKHSEWGLIEGHIDSFMFSIIAKNKSLALTKTWFNPKT